MPKVVTFDREVDPERELLPRLVLVVVDPVEELGRLRLDPDVVRNRDVASDPIPQRGWDRFETAAKLGAWRDHDFFETGLGPEAEAQNDHAQDDATDR